MGPLRAEQKVVAICEARHCLACPPTLGTWISFNNPYCYDTPPTRPRSSSTTNGQQRVWWERRADEVPAIGIDLAPELDNGRNLHGQRLCATPADGLAHATPEVLVLRPAGEEDRGHGSGSDEPLTA